jgi:hypothetical protein
VLGPPHPEAVPAALTAAEEFDGWLIAPTEEALKLQRPVPDELQDGG